MIFKQNRAHKGNSLKQKNLLKSLTTMNCPPRELSPKDKSFVPKVIVSESKSFLAFQLNLTDFLIRNPSPVSDWRPRHETLRGALPGRAIHGR